MGCRNSTFIQHSFEVIKYKSEGGKILNEFQFSLVGTDFKKLLEK